MKRVKNIIKTLRSNKRLLLYTAFLGGVVVDFFRNSLYSITATVIITLVLKYDTMLTPSVICFLLGIVLLIISSYYATRVAVYLKRKETLYDKGKKRVCFERWMVSKTDLRVPQKARHIRKALLFFFFGIVTLLLSSAFNFLVTKNPDDKLIQKNLNKVAGEIDTLLIKSDLLQLRVQELQKSINNMQKDIDSLETSNNKLKEAKQVKK